VWLLSKKDKFIETLSGGEIQRVCIARALIHSPAIIIGDEPTGNLDRKNADEIISLLERLNQEWKTIIMSTHDEYIVNTLKKELSLFRMEKLSLIQQREYILYSISSISNEKICFMKKVSEKNS